MMSSLRIIAVLTVISLDAALATPNVERPEGIKLVQKQSEIDTEVERLLQSDTFLAEEDTPVWIADRPDADKPVNYKRLDKDILRRTVEYGSGKNRGTATNISNFSAESLENSALSKGKVQTGLPVNGNELVYRPSVLVTMDYTEKPWPTDKNGQERLIMERLLYALAFWNSVDLQLRHLNNPKVRLRIAGIVIGRNKEATPYIRGNEKSNGFDLYAARTSMYKHWLNVIANNSDFREDSYEFIATATDLRAPYGQFWSITGQKNECYNKSMIPNVIFSDDLAFKGIPVAVHVMARGLLGPEVMIGASEDGNVFSKNPNTIGRTWSESSLRQISKSLLKSCGTFNLTAYNPPRKPIETILPGKQLDASAQCKARGKELGIVCWKYVSCNALFCADDPNMRTCRSVGPPLDGTACGTAMMCLDGKCVSNTTRFMPSMPKPLPLPDVKITQPNVLNTVTPPTTQRPLPPVEVTPPHVLDTTTTPTTQRPLPPVEVTPPHVLDTTTTPTTQSPLPPVEVTRSPHVLDTTTPSQTTSVPLPVVEVTRPQVLNTITPLIMIPQTTPNLIPLPFLYSYSYPSPYVLNTPTYPNMIPLPLPYPASYSTPFSKPCNTYEDDITSIATREIYSPLCLKH